MAAAALAEAVSSSGGSLDGSGGSGGSSNSNSSSRHEKSLGLLTTKFVSLLQEAKDGVLDLKAVSWSVGWWRRLEREIREIKWGSLPSLRELFPALVEQQLPYLASAGKKNWK